MSHENYTQRIKALNIKKLREKRGDDYIFMANIKGKKFEHKHPNKEHPKRAFRKKKK